VPILGYSVSSVRTLSLSTSEVTLPVPGSKWSTMQNNICNGFGTLMIKLIKYENPHFKITKNKKYIFQRIFINS
jgi:hypothetical protein